MNFIPAQESHFFRKIFRIYIKWAFRWRFKKIWIHQAYNPSKSDKTVYFLNHTSWWDGLIPFLLNEYKFNQKGRAMMEYKQMRTYPFFKFLGAFSIMPHNRSHNLKSLRYAVKSMQRQHASLFIYPQGEITAAGSKMKFKRGIGWLGKQLPNVDFVPVAISVHTIRQNKPELHLWIDNPIRLVKAKDISKVTHIFEQEMEKTLSKLKQSAGFNDRKYQPFF